MNFHALQVKVIPTKASFGWVRIFLKCCAKIGWKASFLLTWSRGTDTWMSNIKENRQEKPQMRLTSRHVQNTKKTSFDITSDPSHPLYPQLVLPKRWPKRCVQDVICPKLNYLICACVLYLQDLALVIPVDCSETKNIVHMGMNQPWHHSKTTTQRHLKS